MARIKNPSTTIVKFDVDDADYCGDGEDGVYVCVGEKGGQWYYTAVVDSNTAHYVDDLVIDQGPFVSEEDARVAGRGVALEWCTVNGVSWKDEPHEILDAL